MNLLTGCSRDCYIDRHREEIRKSKPRTFVVRLLSLLNRQLERLRTVVARSDFELRVAHLVDPLVEEP